MQNVTPVHTSDHNGNGNQLSESRSKPLVIFFAELSHADMANSSFQKKLIELCLSSKLETKIFSEFESQTYKTNLMTWMQKGERERAINGDPIRVKDQLRHLRNTSSEQDHIETTNFLDEHLTTMGQGVKLKWSSDIPQTWNDLPDAIKKGTPEGLLKHFKVQGAIDNSKILELMEGDVLRGNIPWEDQRKANTTLDVKSYYDYWAEYLNYKFIHKNMAQSIKENLADQAETPDVIIMIAKSLHIQGLNKYFNRLFPEFANSPRVIIRKENVDKNVDDKKMTDIDCEVKGKRIEFGFDRETKQVIIPDVLTKIIEDFKSKIESPNPNPRLRVATHEAIASKGRSPSQI